MLLIRNGTVLDGEGMRKKDILIDESGVIVRLEDSISSIENIEEIDVDKFVVAPSFVDMHTHLRVPGNEEAEDIESATTAAVLGGFTHLVAMPNTDPVIDSVSKVFDLKRRIQNSNAKCEIIISSAITCGRMGKELVDFRDLSQMGIMYFTDDGNGVDDPELFDFALALAQEYGVTVAQHLEFKEFRENKYFVNEGEVSSYLGMSGIKAVSEEAMLARDLAIAAHYNVHYHAMHVSTRRSVELIRIAKQAGINVTAEVTPHHLLLDEREVLKLDSTSFVNPPLRTEEDCLALRKGILDGTIDAIATDHAPHLNEVKDQPFISTAPGFIGLESAFRVSLSAICKTSKFGDVVPQGAESVVKAMSLNPAKILKISGKSEGGLGVGSVAEIVVLDMNSVSNLDASSFSSKSRNTPFDGMELRGKVVHTIRKGKLVVKNGILQS